MRRTPFAIVMLPLLVGACGGSDGTGPTTEKFSATLAGANEVPAVTSTATGSATFEVLSDTAIAFQISVAGLTGATQGHIHTGASGATGSVLVWLLPANGTAVQTPSPTLTGVISVGTIAQSWLRGTTPITFDSLKKLMRNRTAYVNLHTATNGGGEIRGQIAPAQ
jgi:CHRD domain